MPTNAYVRKYISTPSEVNFAGTDQWSCTGMNVVTCNYLWKIERFSFIRGEVYSQKFAAKHYDKIKWQMFMNIQPGYAKFGVKLAESDRNQVNFKLLVHQINAEGMMISQYRDKSLNSLNKTFPNVLYFMQKYVDKMGSDTLPNDTFTLVCQIEVAIYLTYSMPPAIYNSNAHQNTFTKSLWKLYQSGLFCDTTLLASGKELNVHKVVLAANSEVFANMFQHELEERKSNRVVITDIKVHVLEEMLLFMYLGIPPNTTTMAAELLHAADKYVVEDLKKQCEIVLGNSITVNTAIEILELAQLHSLTDLEQLAICFIKDNIYDVIDKNKWPHIKAHISDLRFECLLSGFFKEIWNFVYNFLTK